jgi:BNR/Asp-box repeat.
MRRHSNILAAVLLALLGGTAAAEVPVYTPALTSDKDEDASYPRIIRLTHVGKDNGVLIATFFHKGARTKATLPVYRSEDNGKTWSKQPIGVVRDAGGRDIDAPSLFELPKAMGDLPEGALLAAGTVWNHGDFTQQDMQVYASVDGGRHWTYRSSCARETGMPNRMGLGIWEPAFAVAADGSLVCYFSDERPSVDGYNQVLAHVRSTDGGKTWGKEVWDVAAKDGVSRPGMTTVIRLPDSRYAMVFEVCRKDLDPDTACSVRFKTSPDGLNWNSAANMGTLVATADGKHLLHTPMIAWSSYGGPQGTLIVTGQRVVTGPEGKIKVLPESGRVVFVNTKLGQGPWQMRPSPLVIDPTGGYAKTETPCPGYSSPILPDMSGPGFQVTAGLRIANGKCRVAIGRGKL